MDIIFVISAIPFMILVSLTMFLVGIVVGFALVVGSILMLLIGTFACMHDCWEQRTWPWMIDLWL